MHLTYPDPSSDEWIGGAELLGAERWASDDGLMPACRHALEGRGKHLRPRVVRAAAAIGPDPDQAALRQAVAAVELVHVASLLHDDVVDDGHVRRGRPTVGALFGKRAAVLGGTYLFARATALVAGCPEPCHQLFADACCAVCDGQMLEIQDLFDLERSPDRYSAAIAGKTASLFALAAALGGVVGGHDDAGVEALRRYGHELGMAFQIADDLLDLQPSSARLGKPGGADLAHGVYTLPTILALRADPKLAAELAGAGGRPDLAAIGARVRAVGVPGAIAVLREHVASAEAALAGLGADARAGELAAILHESTLATVESVVAC